MTVTGVAIESFDPISAATCDRPSGRKFRNPGKIGVILSLFCISAPISDARVKLSGSPFQDPLPAAQAQKEAPLASPGAATTSQAIPLSQIADRADELDRLLKEISAQLAPTPELVEADRKLKTQAKDVEERAAQTERLLDSMPNSLQLRDEEVQWQTLGKN